MNTRAMRRLDRWLGVLPDYVLTVLVWLLRGRRSSGRKGRLVLVKLFGAGSLVLMSQSLERFEVDARDVYLVTFMSNQTAARLVGFQNIVGIRSSSFVSLAYDFARVVLRLVAEVKPQAIVDFEFYSRATSVLTKLVSLVSGAHSVGFWDGDLPRARGYSSFMPFSYATHITNLYEAGLGAAGLERRLLHTARIAERRSPAAPVVLINPNASDLALGRRWPEDRFVELIVRLTDRFPELQIGLTGEAHEATTTTRIVEEVRRRAPLAHVDDFAGKWDFATFWGRLKGCLMLLTNDSGPVHFASYLGVPSVSLWGPGSPHQFGPLDNQTHRAIWSAFPCSPCMYLRGREPGGFCGQTFPCMGDIEVQAVFEACSEVIEREMERLPTRAPSSVALP